QFDLETVSGRGPSGPVWVPPIPFKLALQAANGQYVVAELGGGERVRANRNRVGPWEVFDVVPRPSGRVSLRTSDDRHYFFAEGGGGGRLTAEADAAGAWERYEDPPPTVLQIGAFGESGIGFRSEERRVGKEGRGGVG